MKSSSWCRSVVLAAASLLAAHGAAPPAQGQGRAPLFVEAPEPARANLATRDRAARRARRLRVSAPALAGLLRPDAPTRPAHAVNLFPDVVLTVVRERLDAGRFGHTSWIGHVDGDAESTVSLTWDGRVLSGGVVTGGRAYDLAPGIDGTVTVVERGADPPARELPSLEPPPSRAAGPYVQDLAANGSTAAVDLLLLYTPAASASAGGAAQIESQLANAVAVTNAAFQRSGLNAVMTAVGVQELAYVEGEGLRKDLDAISINGAAHATVETLRTAAGADLVALVTGRPDTSGGCGIGWLGPASTHGFTVTEQVCLYAGQWSLTHELGHNFGARHAPGDTIDTTPTCGTYACAYREGTIRTLMAYYIPGSAPSRVLNFSSASVREPAATGVPTGNSLQDNARQLRETVGAVSTYRPPLPPGVPRQFTATVTGSTVTMSWLAPASGGGLTGYELEAGTGHGAANLLSTSVTGSTLSVAGVRAGTYFARLRGVNAAGRSEPTEDIAIVVGGCSAPGPIALSAQSSGGVVSLAWTTPVGSAPFSYTLGAGSAPGGVDRGILPMGGVTGFAIAPPPGVYYVKAIATNACGNGPISNEVVVAVP
jgi:peptidyl-Asp metalloendopeptidase